MSWILTTALCLLAWPYPLFAVQAERRAAAGPSSPASADSAEIRARARAAQRRFERLRERHLPRVPARSGRCDEIVGRFCVWHEPDETRVPPPEAPAVSAARDALLEELAVLARALPGDRWIVGQRVRYLQEAGRHAEAIDAARDCRSPGDGECAALVGYALHGAGDHADADSAFAAALLELPPGERCRRSDLVPLLDGHGRKRYRKRPCAERADFEARFWWLADPLYLVPGNERRTEHHWRHVMDVLQEDAASAYRMSWGDDLRELLLRYGWPGSWEKSWSRPGGLGSGGGIVAHDPPGSRRFAPRGRWIEEPGTIASGDWELRPRHPRSHYAPAYAREFRRLEPVIARFRRGDTSIVIAAFGAASLEPLKETDEECGEMEAGLFLTTGPSDPAAEDRSLVATEPTPPSREAREPATLLARLADTRSDLLVSVEARCRGAPRAARARHALRIPAAEPAISDLLIGRPLGTDSLPVTLDAAADRARAIEPLHPGERTPLYWEVYSPRGSTTTAVRVELVRRGGGLFRKLASWTGLVGGRRPLTGMRWADRRAAPGTWSRAVALEIPEDAPRGRYTLRVTVTLDDGLPLTTERGVEIGRPER